MFKFLILNVLLCLSQTTFGAAAVCGRYSAVRADTGAAIEIVSLARNYDTNLGEYLSVSTSISGATNTNCKVFFSEGDQTACNSAVTKVVLVSDVDCWNSAPTFVCQKDAEQMLISILKVQEKNNKILVKTLSKNSVIDEVGNHLETYDIQGFQSQSSSIQKIRVPSRIDMFVEGGGRCVLMGYLLPTAS